MRAPAGTLRFLVGQQPVGKIGQPPTSTDVTRSGHQRYEVLAAGIPYSLRLCLSCVGDVKTNNSNR